MRKISGMMMVLLVSVMSVSAVFAEQVTYTEDQYWLSDTPTKYGPKGLYTLFSPDTYQKGKFGLGFYWDMTRFAIPGDPRYPVQMNFTVGGAYGITDKIEVSASMPYVSYKLSSVSSNSRELTDIALEDYDDSGMGDLSLGLRFKAVEFGKGAFTPFVQAFLPTGDAEKGTGADNTRILLGASVGTELDGLNKTRLYTQLAYQFATDYDQPRKDFSENTRPYERPRFQRFGTNPFYREYGNTLWYGAGFALPIVENTFEIFSEFTGFHSFDDKNYIPMYEVNDKGAVEELDVVQDGGMLTGGARIGFQNGLVLTAGGGGQLYGKEPLYNNPHYTVFAGVTYNRPHVVKVFYDKPEIPVEETGEVPSLPTPILPRSGEFDCSKIELAMVHFEFDKSTLTPEGIATLQQLARLLRVCDQTVIEVQGHTDWIGTENYNMGLGNRRARAVVYYLVYDEGIDPARIVKPEKLERGIIAGETYGESVPIASNETDSGRALNRRAQFPILRQDTRLLRQ